MILNNFKLKIQGKINVCRIKYSKYFDEDWYKKHYNLKNEKNVAYHYYSVGWHKGYDPSLRFSTKGYQEKNSNVDICPLLDYELFKKENNRKIVPTNIIYSGNYKEKRIIRKIKRNLSMLINIPYIVKNRNKKILVVLHLFYYYSFDEIKEYLKNINCYNYDLIITIPNNTYKDEIINKIKDFKYNTKIIKCKNAGYDVSSFINVIKETNLKMYDVVIKLQSKGTDNKTRFCYKKIFKNRDWFLLLYEGILNSFKVHKNLDLLFNNSKIGIVASKDLIINDPKHKQNMLRKNIAEIKLKYVENYKFVAGTCFAIKSCLLDNLKTIPDKYLDFEIQKNRKMEFSLAHILERYFCFSLIDNNMQFYGTSVCKFNRLKWKKIEKKLNELSALNILNSTKYNITDDFAFFFLEGNFIDKVEIKEMKIKNIKRDWYGKIYSLKECSPYKYLEGDIAAYKKYVEFHKENNLPIMTLTRFNTLIENIKKNGYDRQYPIIVDYYNNTVLDGQHRCCILLKLYGENFIVPVIKISFLNINLESIKPFSDEIDIIEL